MPNIWSGKLYFFLFALVATACVLAGVAVQQKIEDDREKALNQKIEWENLTREIAEKQAIQKAIQKNTEYIRCLATNIYHEAAGEPFMGQVAVARVVVNRINHGFASNPCRVVYQKTLIRGASDTTPARILCQFSWVCENKNEPKRNSKAYKQAEEIATKVLYEDGWVDAVPHNVLFFHATSVNPRWPYQRAMVIGNHIFYKK